MAELVREIMIDATPDTIWPFLTTADKHLEWEGTEAEIDARPGGRHRVVIRGQFECAGEYVVVVPNEKLVYTFGWTEPGNPVPPGSTTVEITLHPEGAKTRLRLVHRGLPDEMVEPHVHGWSHYLDRLAVRASGGDPGPDPGPGGGD